MTLKQLYDHFPEWSLETGLIIVHLDGEEFLYSEYTCFHDCFEESLYSDTKVILVNFENMIFTLEGK